MTALAESVVALEEPHVSRSPAGPADDEPTTHLPPSLDLSPALQALRFTSRPMSFAIGAHRRFGDVWTMRTPMRPEGMVVTCHPDHLESLLRATPADAPSLTGESPLGPILGPNSVLTSVGERHMRQRKLLLPPFHGEAVQRYVQMISEVAEAEIDRWPIGVKLSLAPRMQAVTLEVIMRGIFGITSHPDTRATRATRLTRLTRATRAPETRMRETIRRLLGLSTARLYQLIELSNAGRREPREMLAAMLRIVDRQMYAVIRARRDDPGHHGRDDVLSLLLEARDEDGRPLTDQELRDELMSLVLAGHETTANSLAWTFERLLRTPSAYDRLRVAVRSGNESEKAEYIEATIHEAMRCRPVIPMIVRKLTRRWRWGDYVLPENTATAVSIIAMHHRSDIYPRAQRFEPERFVANKPGTYTWIPFGGGIRRCLGATLAMAEQRVVLEAIARRTDLDAPDPAPEAPRMRNVTMIPGHGCRMRVRALTG